MSDILMNKESKVRSLDGLIEHSDVVFDDVASERNELKEKIKGIVNNITIENDESPKSIEAKVALFKMYDDILNDKEKSFTNRINIRQKQKTLESNNTIGIIVAEALKKVNVNSTYISDKTEELSESSKHELEKRFRDLNKNED